MTEAWVRCVVRMRTNVSTSTTLRLYPQIDRQKKEQERKDGHTRSSESGAEEEQRVIATSKQVREISLPAGMALADFTTRVGI